MSFHRLNVDYRTGDAIQATNWSKQQVEAYASRVAQVYGIGVAGDIAELVRRLGGAVRYRNIAALLDQSGSIFVHAPNDFDILIPNYTSPLRDRFTIAHELGHYFLHSHQGDWPLIAARQGSTRIEWEANWFAAELLMPRGAFDAALEQAKHDLIVVAEQFQVSLDAAKVRSSAS